MQDELSRLTRAHPLPAGFSSPQLAADVVHIGGVPVRRAGVACASSDGTELTGSAAELDASPVPRAYFELLERAAILEARGRTCVVRDAEGMEVGRTMQDEARVGSDPRTRPARSNGVALHRTWEEACRRAAYELAERDRVLRSWYGELRPMPAAAPETLAPFSTHRWRVCSIPEEASGASVTEVAVVIGFPRRPELPLTRGFAGGATIDAAIEAAAREALQSLAFLWDERVPSSAPAAAPTPMFHLDYYLWPGHHGHLTRWLDGEHRRPRADMRTIGETRFVDLTPACFGDSLYVARAIRDDARVLFFGESACPPPALAGSHVHPIA